MKLFTVGPVEMYDFTKATGAKQNKYFRTSDFSELMLETSDMLKKALFAPPDYHSIFLTCSGTGAMDASIANCFTTRDRILLVNGGTFGKYFADICTYRKIPYDEIVLDFGSVLTKDMLESHIHKDTTALLINIHETSTGQLYDMQLVSDFCKKHNLYLVVDAISSAFADEYDITRYNIDLTIISTQKAIALPPGVSIVLLSNKLYKARVRTGSVESMYFDFKLYVKNFERGQTPFTPAIGIMYQLHEMLAYILDEGIESRISKTRELAQHFRAHMQCINIEIPHYPLSNALTPLVFDGISARTVYERLRDEYGFYVNPNGYLADRICRVGHLGKIEKSDLTLLALALGEIMKDVCR